MAKNKNKSTQHELVECDLEFPLFQKQIKSLTQQEYDELDRCIDKIESMTWQQIYQTSSRSQKRGLNWEPLQGQKTASGCIIASIRVTKKFRARVTRTEKYMKFISLHSDHDSAYQKKGGEDV